MLAGMRFSRDWLAAVAAVFMVLATVSGAGKAMAAGGSMIVIGDSLADGLYTGLYTLLRDEDGPNLAKQTRVSTGLVRYDKYNWTATARKIAQSHRYDTAVVSFGANDLISFRTRSGPIHYKYNGETWAEAYGERVAEIVRTLRSGGMKVYWVGLPISRKDRFQRDYAFLNTIFRKQATANGATYIDTWSAFAVNGKYSDYGTDINGKSIVLRHTDGVHFTGNGYVSYAKVVLDAIKPSNPFRLPAKLR